MKFELSMTAMAFVLGTAFFMGMCHWIMLPSIPAGQFHPSFLRMFCFSIGWGLFMAFGIAVLLFSSRYFKGKHA